MKHIGIFICILMWAVVCIAKETVSFSRGQVPLGQSVELVFSSDVPITQAPDLTSLTTDFSVAGQQTQTLSSVVNGNVSQSYQLIYNLLPRRTGTLTIAGLTVNSNPLPTISLTVTKGPDTSEAQGALKLTATVSKNKIYQGESFVYTMQLFDPIGISDGEFMPPILNKAGVQQLGKDELFTKMMKGKPVQVFQRQYLITPEEAGDFTLKPGQFQGLASVRRGTKKNTTDLFEMGLLFDGLMTGQQRVFAVAEPSKIEVLARPSDWEGWWLPSSGVTLTEVYHLPDEINKGSTVERVITLTAKGVQAEDLPQIIQSGASGLNVYPSPEKRENQHNNDTLTGVLTVSIVLVPTRAGELIIPAISIPWFNTTTAQKEIAILPPKTIMVAGQVEVTPILSAPVAAQEADAGYGAWILWISLIGGILIGGGIMGGIAYFAIKRKEQNAKKEKPLPDLYPF